jgi:hypothetical protein
MKRYIAILIPVILFALWVLLVFFNAINSGKIWQVVFATLALVITFSLIILIVRKLSKKAAD